MTYKNRVLDLVQTYLLQTKTFEEVEHLLGGWNDPTRKEARNAVIDDTLAQIKREIIRNKD